MSNIVWREMMQRQATARMAELSRSYAAALDAAAMQLLAHGCRDIAHVLQPNGVDELWIDAPADRQRVGDRMPGRCVYRQRMRADDGIVAEWLDPELAAAARGGSAVSDAAGARAAYVCMILDMPAGPKRRAEIRQMLVDLLDVVEQTPDEDPLIAALEAYDGSRP